jgi:hypothetical protein
VRPRLWTRHGTTGDASSNAADKKIMDRTYINLQQSLIFKILF